MDPCFIFTVKGFKFLLTTWLVITSHIFPSKYQEVIGCPESCRCVERVEKVVLSVNCDSSNLDKIPSKNVSSEIERFQLQNNHITEVPTNAFHKLWLLQVLELYNNGIMRLMPDCFKGLYSLHSLSLRNNRIRKITSIVDLPSLEILDLGRNFISNIASADLQGVAVFRPMRLILKNNYITQLLQITPVVDTLYGDYNRLATIDIQNMMHASDLVDVSLQNNYIVTIPDLKNMTSLKNLDLSGNYIHRIPSTFPDSLDILHLSSLSHHLDISHLANLPRLRLLTLLRNGITDLHNGALEGMDALSSLSLFHNSFKSPIRFPALPELYSLELKSCGLVGAFLVNVSSLPQLHTLFVSDNKLTSVLPTNNTTVTGNGTKNISGDQPASSNMEILIIADNLLTDLCFLEYFPKIFSVNAEGNRIRTLDRKCPSNHQSLLSLSLKRNNIIYISDFSNLPHLKSIVLSENDISFIDPKSFSESSNLLVMYLHENKLDIFPSLFDAKVSVTKVINLGGNNLKQIEGANFQQYRSLRELDLRKNYLEIVSLPFLPSLRHLYLQDNSIVSIDNVYLPNVSNVVFLDLSRNNISFIRDDYFKPVPNLVKLVLSGNRLTTSSFVTSMMNLRYLYVEENDITDLWKFNNISSTPSYVVLARNNLWRIPSQFFNSDEVDLSNNRVSGLLPGTFNDAIELFLNNNSIWHISAGSFVNCSRLRILNLSANPLNDIEPDTLLQLDKFFVLDVSYSNIDISTKGLIMNSKRIHELRLTNVPSIFSTPSTSIHQSHLRLLVLEHNSLSFIPNLIGKNLRELYLGYNLITAISAMDFKTSRYLRHLDLTGNRLTSLAANPFRFSSHLQSLNLDNNRLQTIDPGTFDHLKHLISLRIAGNRFTTLSGQNLPPFSRLTVFHFEENPWCCSCGSSREFGEWLVLSGIETVICRAPPKYQGLNLLAVQEERCYFDNSVFESSGTEPVGIWVGGEDIFEDKSCDERGESKESFITTKVMEEPGGNANRLECTETLFNVLLTSFCSLVYFIVS